MSDGRIDALAAVGFRETASTYDAFRPGYPAALVARLAELIGAGAGKRVLDLGAGTGKMTRALVALGADVVAVEPVAEMRAQLVAASPDVEALDGTAEAVPLPDVSVDAVVAAQSFHWFDTAATLDEIARVLRPGGGLGLVWNERSSRRDWMNDFETLADQLAANPQSYRGRSWQAVLDADPRFTPRAVESVEVQERRTPEWLVQSVATRSWVASKTKSDRDALVAGLMEFLATDPATAGRAELVHVHPCVAHWCHLAPV